MAQRPQRHWELLPPLICKYCHHKCVTISRYLSHLRHHELWIQPYWYVKRPFTIDAWRKALRKKLSSSKRLQWDSTGQTYSNNIDHNHGDTNNNAIHSMHEEQIHPMDDNSKMDNTPFVKKHLCVFCGKGFRVKNILKKHQEIHTEDEFVEEVSRSSELFRDMSSTRSCKLVSAGSTGIHTSDGEIFDEQSRKLSGLDFSFSKQQTKDHPKTGNVPLVKHQCGYCDQIFPRENILMNHMMSHMEDEPFHNKSISADIPKLSSGEASLESKIRYSCQYCGKMFRVKNILRKHMEVHLHNAFLEDSSQSREFPEYLSSETSVDLVSADKSSNLCKPYGEIADEHIRKCTEDLGVAVPLDQVNIRSRTEDSFLQTVPKRRAYFRDEQPEAKFRHVEKENKMLQKRKKQSDKSSRKKLIRYGSSPKKLNLGGVDENNVGTKPGTVADNDDGKVAKRGSLLFRLPKHEKRLLETASDHPNCDDEEYCKTLTKDTFVCNNSVLKEKEPAIQNVNKKLHPVAKKLHPVPAKLQQFPIPNKQVFPELALSNDSAESSAMKENTKSLSSKSSNTVILSIATKFQEQTKSDLPKVDNCNQRNCKTVTTSSKQISAENCSSKSPKKLTKRISVHAEGEINPSKQHTPKKLTKFTKSVHEESVASHSKQHSNSNSKIELNRATEIEDKSNGKSPTKMANQTQVFQKQDSQVEEPQEGMHLTVNSELCDKDKYKMCKTAKDTGQVIATAKLPSQMKIEMENQKELEGKSDTSQKISNNQVTNIRLQSHRLVQVNKTNYDDIQILPKHLQQSRMPMPVITEEMSNDQQTCKQKDQNFPQLSQVNIQESQELKLSRKRSVIDNVSTSSKPLKKRKLSSNISANMPVNTKQPPVHLQPQRKSKYDELKQSTCKSNDEIQSTSELRKEQMMQSSSSTISGVKVTHQQSQGKFTHDNPKKTGKPIKLQKSKSEKLTHLSQKPALEAYTPLFKKPILEKLSQLLKKVIPKEKTYHLSKKPTSEKPTKLLMKPTPEMATNLPNMPTVEKTTQLTKKPTSEKSTELIENLTSGKTNQLTKKPTSEKPTQLTKNSASEEAIQLSNKPKPEKNNQLSKRSTLEKINRLKKKSTSEEPTQLTKKPIPEEPNQLANKPTPEKPTKLSKKPVSEKTNQLSKKPMYEKTHQLTKKPQSAVSTKLSKMAKEEKTKLSKKSKSKGPTEWTKTAASEKSIRLSNEPKPEKTNQLLKRPVSEKINKLTEKSTAEEPTQMVTKKPIPEEPNQLANKPTPEKPTKLSKKPVSEKTNQLSKKPMSEKTHQLTKKPQSAVSTKLSKMPKEEKTNKLSKKSKSKGPTEWTKTAASEKSIRLSNEPKPEKTNRLLKRPVSEKINQLSEKSTSEEPTQLVTKKPIPEEHNQLANKPTLENPTKLLKKPALEKTNQLSKKLASEKTYHLIKKPQSALSTKLSKKSTPEVPTKLSRKPKEGKTSRLSKRPTSGKTNQLPKKPTIEEPTQLAKYSISEKTKQLTKKPTSKESTQLMTKKPMSEETTLFSNKPPEKTKQLPKRPISEKTNQLTKRSTSEGSTQLMIKKPISEEPTQPANKPTSEKPIKLSKKPTLEKTNHLSMTYQSEKPTKLSKKLTAETSNKLSKKPTPEKTHQSTKKPTSNGPTQVMAKKSVSEESTQLPNKPAPEKPINLSKKLTPEKKHQLTKKSQSKKPTPEKSNQFLMRTIAEKTNHMAKKPEMTTQLAKKPTSEKTNQLTKKPSEEPTQLTKKLTSERTYQLTKQPTSEKTKFSREPTPEKTNQLAKKPTSKKPTQLPNKPIPGKANHSPVRSTSENFANLFKKTNPQQTNQLPYNVTERTTPLPNKLITEEIIQLSKKKAVPKKQAPEKNNHLPQKSTSEKIKHWQKSTLKTTQLSNKPMPEERPKSPKKPTSEKACDMSKNVKHLAQKSSSHEVYNTNSQSQAKLSSDDLHQPSRIVQSMTVSHSEYNPMKKRMDATNHASEEYAGLSIGNPKCGSVDSKENIKDNQLKQLVNKQASQDKDEVNVGGSSCEKDQAQNRSVAKCSKYGEGEEPLSLGFTYGDSLLIPAANESSSTGCHKTNVSQSKLGKTMKDQKDNSICIAKKKTSSVKLMKKCKKIVKCSDQGVFKPDSKVTTDKSKGQNKKKGKLFIKIVISSKAEMKVSDVNSGNPKGKAESLRCSTSPTNINELGHSKCKNEVARVKVHRCKCGQRFTVRDAFCAHRMTCKQNEKALEEQDRQINSFRKSQAETDHSFESTLSDDAQSPQKQFQETNIPAENFEDLSRPDSHKRTNNKSLKITASNPEKYKCETCGLHFRHKETLVNHKSSCKQPVGEVSRTSSANKDSEQEETTSTKSACNVQKQCSCMKCAQCYPKTANRKTSTISTTDVNNKSTGKSDEYVCPFSDCQKVVSTMQSLERHIETHSSDREIYECDLCDKKYLHKRSLREHKLLHVGHQFKCGECGEGFNNRLSLISHKKKPHDRDIELFPCQHAGCGEVFKFKKSLFLHSQSHARKNYKCDKCCKTFTSQKSLDDHIEANCELRKHCRSNNCAKCHPGKQNEKKKPAAVSSCGKRSSIKSADAPSSTYACSHPDCNKVLSSKASLEHHQLTHGSERDYFKCDLCDKKYLDRSTLMEHKLTKHTKHRYQCRECKKEFTYRTSLIVHEKAGHKPAPDGKPCYGELHNFPCRHKDCGLVFESKIALSHHKITVHMKKDIFKCETCDKTFISQKSLTAHRDMHNDELKPFHCGACGMAFQHQATLHSHKYRFHRRAKGMQKDIKMYSVPAEFHSKIEVIKIKGTLTYKCKLCSKRLPSLRQFSVHAQVAHMGKQIFRCRFCLKSFPARSVCKNHEEQVHLGVKRFKCCFCFKAFSSKGHCKEHEMAIHTMEKKFSCHLCDYRAVNSNMLKIHIRSHTKEKPYKCSYPDCNKAFSCRSNCKRHERIHSNIKLHKCEHCDKAFRSAEELQSHEIVHSDEKTFVCETCGKAFKHRGGLLRHRKTHLGVKDHECSYCQKQFYTLQELKSHITSHTGERRIQCRYCPKRFARHSNRNEHEKYTHRGLKKPYFGKQKAKRYFCKICNKEFPSIGHATTHHQTNEN